MGAGCSRNGDVLVLDPPDFVPGQGHLLHVSLGRTTMGAPKVFAELVIGARKQGGVLISSWHGEGFMKCPENEAMDMVEGALRKHGYPVDLAEGVVATAKHRSSEGLFSSPYLSPSSTPNHSEE